MTPRVASLWAQSRFRVMTRGGGAIVHREDTISANKDFCSATTARFPSLLASSECPLHIADTPPSDNIFASLRLGADYYNAVPLTSSPASRFARSKLEGRGFLRRSGAALSRP